MIFSKSYTVIVTGNDKDSAEVKIPFESPLTSINGYRVAASLAVTITCEELQLMKTHMTLCVEQNGLSHAEMETTKRITFDKRAFTLQVDQNPGTVKTYTIYYAQNCKKCNMCDGCCLYMCGAGYT